MDRHFSKFALGAADEADGTFRGIASVFGSLAYGFVLTKFKPGAFKQTLADDGDRVKLLWQHDTSMPIGKPLTLTETSIGLDLCGKISKTSIGQDALVLMRDKVVDELSIGFDALEYSWEQSSDQPEAPPVRIVTKAKVYEISLVTFAADRMAKVTSVHHQVAVATERLFRAGALKDDDRAWLKGVVESFVLDPEEKQEGRVLSGKNLSRLREALKFLQDLLLEAEPPAEEDALKQKGASEKFGLSIQRKLREAELDIIGLSV